MSFHESLQRLFPAAIRSRGQSYFATGRVSIESDEDDVVVATVNGSDSYFVTLRPGDDHELLVSCTCPYVETELEACKHIWATMLDASRTGSFARRQFSHVEIDEEIFADPSDLAFHGASRPRRDLRRVEPPRVPAWQTTLDRISSVHSFRAPQDERLPAGTEIVYVIDVEAMKSSGQVVIEVQCRSRKKDGQWTKPKYVPSRILGDVLLLDDLADREILSLLGAGLNVAAASSWYSPPPARATHRLYWPQPRYLLPHICRSGRLLLRGRDRAHFEPVRWDEGAAWRFEVVTDRDEERREFRIRGELARGEERLPLAEPLALLSGGLVFRRDSIAILDDAGCFPWIGYLRQTESLIVPFEDAAQFRVELLRRTQLPPMMLPEELRFEEVSMSPRPHLLIRPKSFQASAEAVITFFYDETPVRAGSMGSRVVAGERVIRRDLEQERALLAHAETAGVARAWNGSLEIPSKRLPEVIHALAAAGWRIEGEEGLYRSPTGFALSIVSGIDWFDLEVDASFDGERVDLPRLLAALEAGQPHVRLSDGTLGLIPPEWRAKLEPFTDLGSVEKHAVRFQPNQVGLLDALLAAQPEIDSDKVIAAARERLARFQTIRPQKAPKSFQGVLRSYQQDGLGWFEFLRGMGFGGCLADDMGLGKTIQILALLESRRLQKDSDRMASLVVVPRSLIFNWLEEAARFTPKLRVLDHSRPGREADGNFRDHDVVLTTYGTLRRDAAHLAAQTFDYVILDEAQAIKNAASQSAKAARLLVANHRLALSGTPIENHLGELWSLFEFLNPGMFGARRKSRLPSLLQSRGDDENALPVLARALRPFILRRTKDQVARELPARIEQTIHCELEGEQRALYDELREHYRQALLQRVRRDGVQKSKFQILEALLRLRQAACHPGLIDRRRSKQESAKLESLLPELISLVESNRKVLVFSQFTTFLSIVRAQLDARKIAYGYLDGRTRKRQEEVARFQAEGHPNVFLISLKAGGLGLNLTAAEYVFLLDPWWNPAVEAQAIDRAHRIGQTRQVFAYRIVARDTIEEKILQLQDSKRNLAEAIIGGGNSLIRDLKAEDLELLLS